MRFSKLLLIWVGINIVACQKNTEVVTVASPLVSGLKVAMDSIQLRPAEGLVYYQDKPFTGQAVSFFDNGNPASTVEYLNGKKHGLYEKWFASGQQSFSSRYADGKRHGPTYTWWKNGNLRSEGNYEAGMPHGLQKQWYISGARFKAIHLAYGQEAGVQQSWRENGKLYNNYEARNGRIFGLKRANLCYELDDENIQYENN